MHKKKTTENTAKKQSTLFSVVLQSSVCLWLVISRYVLRSKAAYNLHLFLSFVVH